MHAGFIAMTTAAFLMALVPSAAAKQNNVANTIIDIERTALDRWGHGDPDGFLEISDPEVVYFDPFLPRRLNGLEELRKLYDGLRGKIKIDGYEMVDPKVEVAGETAILTYNFVSHGSEGSMRWNTTEVYRHKNGQWKIIHTHWSLTQPKLASD